MATLIADHTIAKKLGSAPEVVLVKNGIDEYGLYVELERYTKTTGKIHSLVRILVTGKVVSFYTLRTPQTRSTWKVSRSPSTEAALAQVSKLMNADSGLVTSVVRGRVLLIQLTPADKALIESGRMPNARYTAKNEADKRNGQFAWDGGVAIVQPVSAAVKEAAAAAKLRVMADHVAEGVAAKSAAPKITAKVTSATVIDDESDYGDEPY